MKIHRVFAWNKQIKLKNPYNITSHAFEEANLVFIQLHLENGMIGIGSGSPSMVVCNESPKSSLDALNNIVVDRVEKESIYHFKRLIKDLTPLLKSTPAALATIDMALYDLFCQVLGVSVYSYLGKHHSSMPTSITIGIQDLAESKADIEKYLAHGFTILKIKIGDNLDRDIELIHKIRELYGNQVKIRVDGNQGYTVQTLQKFLKATEDLDIQFVEQPFQVGKESNINSIPPEYQPKIMLDETVHNPGQLYNILRKNPAYRLLNIKLMKCGGITSALELASLSGYNRTNLMWGCMDESRISITAALMTALSQPNTKYLDLDGHFDLANDIAKGGFMIRNGVMYPSLKPGLGITLKK